MIKFEEHEGKLFRMLEEPVPLTDDTKLPVLVQLIQDDTMLGKANKISCHPDTLVKKRICSYLTDGGLFLDGNYTYRYEIIGTPVAEGSAHWALCQMMQGKKVFNSNRRSFFHYFEIKNGWIAGQPEGFINLNSKRPDGWIEWVGAKSGWEIYEPNQFREATKKEEPDVVDELDSLRSEVNWHIRSRTTPIGYYIRTGKGKDNAIDAVEKLEAFADTCMAERVIEKTKPVEGTGGGARMKDKTYTPNYIVRPSDTIKESMEYSHVTVDDLWEEICLYDMAKLLADEIQINERIAVALSKVLGSQPTFWMNLSNNYFAAKAQEEES